MISVIVLNYNGREVTKECLKSVLASKYTDFELIVVDNASSYQSRQWLPDASMARRVYNERNLLYAGGMNSGIKESKGDIIICLANDTVVHRDWLTNIVETMRDEKIGAATPMILNYKSNRIDTAIPKLGWFGLTHCLGIGEVNRGQYDKEVPDYVSGACFITRRSVIDRVGMFDERMKMYWQDVDLSLRIRKAGYKLALISDATVWHMGGETVKKWSMWRRKWHTNVDRMWGVWKMVSGKYR